MDDTGDVRMRYQFPNEDDFYLLFKQVSKEERVLLLEDFLNFGTMVIHNDINTDNVRRIPPEEWKTLEDLE